MNFPLRTMLPFKTLIALRLSLSLSVSLTLSLSLSLLIGLGLAMPASAALDPAQFRLTPEMLRKLDAAHAEAKRLEAAEKKSNPRKAAADDDPEDDDAENDDGSDGDAADEPAADKANSANADRGGRKDETVEGIARKVDADPRLKALLQRHGISSIDYAMSVHAMLHAGMFLMFEESMPKDKARELFNGYTSAQQSNIELVRKSATVKK
jgi:hypothetical protein